MAYHITLAESYDADVVPDEWCDDCRMYIYDGECDCQSHPLSDPSARLQATKKVGAIMATNLKRKTPCASVKAGFKNLATLSICCHCCGDWIRIGSQIVREV